MPIHRLRETTKGCVMSLAFFFCASAAAAELTTPDGPVVLIVSGDIKVTNQNDTAAFDMEMLQALPAETFETFTIWTEGPQTFTGVRLDVFLELLGVEAGALKAQAINDYAVSVPVADAKPGGPIIAYARNGAPMSVRDKGPLWIMYPFDSDKNYQTEVFYSRSIWQLDRIDVQAQAE